MPTGTSPLPPFAALLLAGGRSRRMGKDKALLEWQGRPLWKVQVEKLLALKPARILVACREEQWLHEDSALFPQPLEWRFDPPGEDLGPIAAITRALEGLTMPLLVLAVDMPWMTADFIQRHLLDEVNTEGLGLFYQGVHGYEPLAGLYVPAMRDVLSAAMQRGRLGLQPVIEAAAVSGMALVRPVPLEAEPLFQNTNTQEEWERVRA